MNIAGWRYSTRILSPSRGRRITAWSCDWSMRFTVILPRLARQNFDHRRSLYKKKADDSWPGPATTEFFVFIRSAGHCVQQQERRCQLRRFYLLSFDAAELVSQVGSAKEILVFLREHIVIYVVCVFLVASQSHRSTSLGEKEIQQFCHYLWTQNSFVWWTVTTFERFDSIRSGIIRYRCIPIHRCMGVLGINCALEKILCVTLHWWTIFCFNFYRKTFVYYVDSKFYGLYSLRRRRQVKTPQKCWWCPSAETTHRARRRIVSFVPLSSYFWILYTGIMSSDSN